MKESAMTRSSVVLPSNRALWIPGLFVLGFLIVIAVNGILIFTAVSSFSGLETDSAYDKGLHYNQVLAAAAANTKTGWYAELSVTAGSSSERRLEVAITDHAGSPVTALQVEAVLVRPTNSGMDMTIMLADLGGGRYRAAFVPKALGNWDLRLTARRGETAWQQVQRIFLK